MHAAAARQEKAPDSDVPAPHAERALLCRRRAGRDALQSVAIRAAADTRLHERRRSAQDLRLEHLAVNDAAVWDIRAAGRVDYSQRTKRRRKRCRCDVDVVLNSVTAYSAFNPAICDTFSFFLLC